MKKTLNSTTDQSARWNLDSQDRREIIGQQNELDMTFGTIVELGSVDHNYVWKRMQKNVRHI